MKLTTMLDSRIRESYQIQLFTTFGNQNLQNHVGIILIVKNFNFMYWSYFWALFALCFHYEIFLDSFGWKKVANYVTFAQAALIIKLLHRIFKIANMAKILYENIKRKLTIVSYRFLALTIPNLVVLYHTPRPQHCD